MKTTDENCFGGLQEESYPFLQNTVAEKVAPAQKVAYFATLFTQELYANCSDQQ